MNPEFSFRGTLIYVKQDLTYWEQLEADIRKLSEGFAIPFISYFYHAKIRKGGKRHD